MPQLTTHFCQFWCFRKEKVTLDGRVSLIVSVSNERLVCLIKKNRSVRVLLLVEMDVRSFVLSVRAIYWLSSRIKMDSMVVYFFTRFWQFEFSAEVDTQKPTTGSENRPGLALVRTTCDKSLKLMTSLQEIVLISTSEHQDHSCVIFLAMV